MGALSRLSNYLNNSETKIVFNSIVKSQVSYCSLVWMFCSRTPNIMINKIHERTLRVVFTDHMSDFGTLLQKNKNVRNHHRIIETLLTEIFKTKYDIARSTM